MSADLGGISLLWGTLAVHVAGTFRLELILQLGSARFLPSTEWCLSLTTGFCGTTRSTFNHETPALLENEQWPAAGGNAVLNVALCRVATSAGMIAARIA